MQSETSVTEQEFIAVFREHKDPVYRFAWRMTGSAVAAEDITQECFLALWRAPGRYDSGRGPWRPFLLGLTRNLVLKRWRAEGRFDALGDDEAVVHRPSNATLGTDVREAVAHAIALLPPPQREVLILAEYEDLRLEEIARMVGVEVSAVKSRLHRARENLRRMLSDWREYARTIE